MPKAVRSIAKKKRHKKWIKRAKGYEGRRKNVFKLAKEAVLTAGQHAYNDRRKKKEQFRSQWQVLINAAARQNGTTYARFIKAMRDKQVGLDRKVLSQIATKHPQIFADIVSQVK